MAVSVGLAVSLAQTTAAAAEAQPAPQLSATEQWIQDVKKPAEWFSWGADLRLRNEYVNNAVTLGNDMSLSEQDYFRFRGRVWTSLAPIPDLSLNARLSAEPREWMKESFAGNFRGQQGLEWPGADLYASRCASCHQADGRGLAGAFPPLIGAEYIVGPPEVPIRIVLLGLRGTLVVAGQEYTGAMPSRREQLVADEIAKILSYLREQSGAPPVDADLVARVRGETANAASPMSTEELRSIVGAR